MQVWSKGASLKKEVTVPKEKGSSLLVNLLYMCSGMYGTVHLQ